MHHAPLPRAVCVTLHRFTKIAEGFKQKSVRSTPNTPLSYAQKQHIASLVCITFSYHVCFPFDAHIHYLTKETVQPSSHFQFVQHELTSVVAVNRRECRIIFHIDDGTEVLKCFKNFYPEEDIGHYEAISVGTLIADITRNK